MGYGATLFGQLLESVLWVTFKLPLLAMAPPTSAELPVRLLLVTVTVALLCTVMAPPHVPVRSVQSWFDPCRFPYSGIQSSPGLSRY